MELKQDIIDDINLHLQDGDANTAADVRGRLLQLLENDYYNTSLPDTTTTDKPVGGLSAGTSVNAIKGQHITNILDQIIFGGQPESIPTFTDSDELLYYQGGKLALFSTDLGVFLMVRIPNESGRANNDLTVISDSGGDIVWIKCGGSPIFIQETFNQSINYENQLFAGYELHEIRMTCEIDSGSVGDLRLLQGISKNETDIDFGQEITGKVIFEIP